MSLAQHARQPHPGVFDVADAADPAAGLLRGLLGLAHAVGHVLPWPGYGWELVS